MLMSRGYTGDTEGSRSSSGFPEAQWPGRERTKGCAIKSGHIEGSAQVYGGTKIEYRVKKFFEMHGTLKLSPEFVH